MFSNLTAFIIQLITFHNFFLLIIDSDTLWLFLFSLVFYWF